MREDDGSGGSHFALALTLGDIVIHLEPVISTAGFGCVGAIQTKTFHVCIPLLSPAAHITRRLISFLGQVSEFPGKPPRTPPDMRHVHRCLNLESR